MLLACAVEKTPCKVNTLMLSVEDRSRSTSLNVMLHDIRFTTDCVGCCTTREVLGCASIAAFRLLAAYPGPEEASPSSFASDWQSVLRRRKWVQEVCAGKPQLSANFGCGDPPTAAALAADN